MNHLKSQKKAEVKNMCYDATSKCRIPPRVMNQKNQPTLAEIIKVSKEDIDVSEDMKAMFGSEDLSEDFRDKATTIFESAVLSKVNEVLESATVDMNAEIEMQKEQQQEPICKASLTIT